jgi:two-component system sensor histidine kinase DegS
LQDVRRSVAAMRAARLEDLALEPSIQRVIAEFGESTGLRAQFRANLQEGVQLPPELAQAVYRALQEGLTNVHRHAHASSIDVSLESSAECVVLDIVDDGVGPNGSNGGQPASGGFGLIGLRERVALLAGQLAFGPAPGRGSRLHIALPIDRAV